MRLIDTSQVTGTLRYPGLANVGGQSVGNNPVKSPGDPTKYQGLDFLQQALLEMVQAIVESQLVNPSLPTWLTYYEDVDTMEGWMYYNNEIFWAEGPSVSEEGHNYLAASVNSNPTDASPNPQTLLSDGITYVSMHNQRTVYLEWSETANAGNLPDAISPSGGWQDVQTNFSWSKPLSVYVVGGGGGAQNFATGWSADNRLIYYILGNEVTIQGNALYANGAADLIFTLPNGMKPAYGITGFGYQSNGSGSNVVPISIGTDGTVNMGFATTGGGALQILIKFTIL